MAFELWSCPHCHRPFERKTENKEFAGKETIQFSNASRFALGSSDTAGGTDVMPGETITKEVIRYKYTYKCKHCGYEWSEVKTEDV